MTGHSEDPVTDAAIEAIIASRLKFRAVCILVGEARDEAFGEYAHDGHVSRADLHAFIGARIQQQHGSSIAGLMADEVNWAEVASVTLKIMMEG